MRGATQKRWCKIIYFLHHEKQSFFIHWCKEFLDRKIYEFFDHSWQTPHSNVSTVTRL